MAKLGLRRKLMILLAVPLLGILYLSMAAVFERFQQRGNAVAVSAMVVLADSAGNLVHELQKERGMSGVFVGSQGQRFGAELGTQVPTTDRRVAEFKTLAAHFDAKSYGTAFADSFTAVLAKLATLPDWRQRVRALGKDGDAAVAEYTAMNALVLDMVARMASASEDAQIARLLVAYVNLSRAKERAGIQRAMLSVVFSAGSFKGREALYGQVATHIGGEGAHLRVFQLQTSDSLRQAVDAKMTDPTVRQADAMRQRALDGLTAESLGVAGSDWFAAQTRKIDLLREVEEQASHEMTAASRALSSEAQWGIITVSSVSGAIILITLVFGVLLVQGIVSSITRISGNLASASDQILSASQQVSASSQSLAQGASEQAASLEETSSTLEEISSMTSQNAGHSDEVENKVGRVRDDAGKGSDAMARMVERINLIKDSSNKTAKIIKTIDEIAFQTNLLALNAAVEAARAGDAGRGFAVVAEEVRSLALRSAQAAKDTSALIEESQQRAEQGVAASSETETLLTAIRSGVESATSVVREVSAASKEQARGVQQITQAVTQMDQVTQSNAANAEENAAASEELSAQAQSLTSIVQDLMTLVTGRNGHMARTAPAVLPMREKEPHSAQAPAPTPAHLGPPNLRERILSGEKEADLASRDADLKTAAKMEFRDLPS